MSYKRNQVEEAVWRFMSRGRLGREPAAVFRTRIKRLLELDRATPPPGSSSADLPAQGMAFAAAPPAGRGHEARFAAFDAFCLALGLLLLNAGFKQGEIVLLLRHIRPGLAEAWQRLERRPLALRQRIAAEERPDLPTYEEGGVRFADTDLYLVLERVEATELFPDLRAATPGAGRSVAPGAVRSRGLSGMTAGREEPTIPAAPATTSSPRHPGGGAPAPGSGTHPPPRKSGPADPDSQQGLILSPLLVQGGERLAATLRDRAYGSPGHHVVELSVMAAMLRRYLDQSEPRPRGPAQSATQSASP